MRVHWAGLPRDAEAGLIAASEAARQGTTPARAQYLALKRQHPDALLLFRMGDFYETFDDDARTVARVTGVALTSRPMGKAEGRIPLAGVPYHALGRYLDQIVAAGHRVAIVEQVSPPGRRLVERRVVRVVTPGTAEAGTLPGERGHNWLVALTPEGGAAQPSAGGWRPATSPPASSSYRWSPRRS